MSSTVLSKEDLFLTFKDKCAGNSQTNLNDLLAEQCVDMALEYAQQQSIAFAEWAAKNYNKYVGDNVYWSQFQSHNIFTTKQLYTLFLQSTQTNK